MVRTKVDPKYPYTRSDYTSINRQAKTGTRVSPRVRSRSFTPALLKSVSPALSKSVSPALSKSVSTALSKSVAPAHSKSVAPALSKSVSPALSKSVAPAHSKSVAPAHSKTDAPVLSKSDAPVHSKSVAPAHSNSDAPAHSKSVAPAHSKSVAPEHSKSVPPAHSKSVAPVPSDATNKTEDISLQGIQVCTAVPRLDDIRLDQNGRTHSAPQNRPLQTLQIPQPAFTLQNNQIFLLSQPASVATGNKSQPLTLSGAGILTFAVPVNQFQQGDVLQNILPKQTSNSSKTKTVMNHAETDPSTKQNVIQGNSNFGIKLSEVPSTSDSARLDLREDSQSKPEDDSEASVMNDGPRIEDVYSVISLPRVSTSAGQETSAHIKTEGQSSPIDPSSQFVPAESDQNGAMCDKGTENEETPRKRKCVACLRESMYTQDIFDSRNRVLGNVEPLLLLIPAIKINQISSGSKVGVCFECMDTMQRWFIFSYVTTKKQQGVEGHRSAHENNSLEADIKYLQDKIYKNYNEILKVQEVFSSATHAHYARRHLTQRDLDFFCENLFHPKKGQMAEKAKVVERFIFSLEKLSHIYCTHCQTLIPDGKEGFESHVQADHPNQPVLYPCDLCGQQLPEKDRSASSEDYFPHWISHFYLIECEDCKKRFLTRRALGQHRHAVHKIHQVVCHTCGKVLKNKMILRLHMARHLRETDKSKYVSKCEICNKMVAKWSMKSHKTTHISERPWKCDECNATFKNRRALVSHREHVHTLRVKKYFCHICNGEYSTSSSLQIHIKRHEGKKDFTCEVCQKQFFTYSALKIHQIAHLTTRDFPCIICGKAFKKEKALSQHSTVHTGEKPYQCEICGRKIRVKSNLIKHMKVHRKNGDIAPSTDKEKEQTKKSLARRCTLRK